MIKRVFPAPLISIALAALWLVLNRSYGIGDWLMAVVLAVIVPLMTQSFRPTAVTVRRPKAVLNLLLRVGLDVIKSNLLVLRGTLARRGQVPEGVFVVVPLDLRDPNGLAVLAVIMCLIPGTIWSELAVDRSTLLVHIFHTDDPQREIALIKARYERPLMEIFQ